MCALVRHRDTLLLVSDALNPSPTLREYAVPDGAASVLARMSDGFVAIDRQWRYVFMNASAGELLGLEPREAIGQHVWTLFPNAVGNLFHHAFERVMAGGPMERVEAPFEPWGRWFENSIYPTAEGIGILFTDITDRKTGEMWADGQRTVLERLARGAPLREVLTEIVTAVEKQCPGSFGSVQLVDPSGRTLRLAAGPRMHPEMRHLIEAGIPIAETGGGTCGVAAATNQVQESPDVFTDPRWEPYRDAARRFGISSCWSAPFCGRDGTVLGTMALYSKSRHVPAVRERTIVAGACQLAAIAVERTRADEALRAREQELAALAAHTPDFVLRVGRDGRFRYVNGNVAQATGIPADSFIGRSLEQMGIAIPNNTVWSQALARALETGETVEVTLESALLPGQRVLDARFVCEWDHSGRADSCLVVLRDMTRQHELEERLRQAQKMEAVGRLAGGVSHDFNNILTAIGGFAGLALDALEADHRAREDLAELQTAVARAAALTRQLLTFSRQQVLTPRVVDLNAVAGGLEPMLRRLIGEDVLLMLVPSREQVSVRADPGQLDQVLVNLAVNARDAMPVGGTLQVEVGSVTLEAPLSAAGSEVPAGRWALLSVADGGEGMDDETRSRIFEPFFTTKALGRGTGLGLSMVYGIVQQSGGHVVVESAPGRGSVFRIYLPLVDESAARAAGAEAGAAAGGAQARVLVVDDESTIRSLVRRILEKQGFEVREAKNGEDALLLTRETPDRFDLLLTDVVMPGMDGRELARRFAALRPDARVLLMSGYTAPRNDVFPEPDGALRLEKPFTAHGLLEAVRTSLQR